VLGNLAVLRDGARVQLPPSKKTGRCSPIWPSQGVRTAVIGSVPCCGPFRMIPARVALEPDAPAALVDEPDCPRIVADRENVGVDLDQVSVDILSLRSVARNGTDSISTDALRDAVQALDGEFLEGLELPDCHEFQSWCTGEREEMRRLRVRLLAALIARLESSPDQAIRHARTLSLLEPASEEVQATLVRLLRTAGRYREAEEQFWSAQRRSTSSMSCALVAAAGSATAAASRCADARGRPDGCPAPCAAAACAARLA